VAIDQSKHAKKKKEKKLFFFFSFLFFFTHPFVGGLSAKKKEINQKKCQPLLLSPSLHQSLSEREFSSS
jgi:hypothetical protein